MRIPAQAQQQRGAALIMVLLLVAMMLILSVGLVDGVRYNSQRLLNQRYMDQGFWYALGGEYLAAYALEDAAGDDTINLGQPWAQDDILFPVDGGSIAGKIIDEQACFNVNSLYPPALADDLTDTADTGAMLVFRGLLQNLEIPIQRADFIIGRLQDWIDDDFAPEGVYGAEDLSYNTGDYPFRPPNRLIDSLSELTLFAEFEAGEQQRLMPMLCALPEVDTVININTLTAEQAPLLAAAVDNLISVENATLLIERRPAAGWPDVESFVAELNLPEETPLAAEMQSTMGVKSQYFKGLADVFYEQRQLRVYSRFVIKGSEAVAYAREYGEIF